MHTSAFGRQRQVDLCEFEASLYIEKFRPTKATQWDLISKHKPKQTQQKTSIPGPGDKAQQVNTLAVQT